MRRKRRSRKQTKLIPAVVFLILGRPANAGLIQLDSVDVDESMYPIVIESSGVIADTQGFGEFEGAPAVGGFFYPLDHDMTIVYAADGTTFPPKGVLGGQNGGASASWKILPGNKEVVLPVFAEVVLEDGAKIAFKACGAGGTATLGIVRDTRRSKT
ncbi:hydantoinase B/oxoprolinase family protein [Rhizobium ruizarguesonis]|uniref:hydantoinase B/oxoprolinase family protein n=1 Tax=Rhizobium ruizarguesonis TaxID=2081791 RepID=UPI001FE085B2|nr:hydantoinase B/oxoprolinase family protein [Rhizobium ruizarguesonis]